MSGVDYRFSPPGADQFFPDPNADARFSWYPQDGRFPAAGYDARFEAPGFAAKLHPEALYSFDFKAGTYFGAPESAFVVVRASPGLAQDLAGNWVSFGNNTLRRTNRGLLVEQARTNLFLNSNAPATQNITVVNGTVYTVSLHGGGTAVVSGAGIGTAADGSPVTFTAAGASLIVTITGSPTYVQVEAGGFATSPIITGGSPITRAADVIYVPISGFGVELTHLSRVPPIKAGVEFAAMMETWAGPNDRLRFFQSQTTNRGTSVVGGAAYQIGPLTAGAGVARKNASRVKPADIKISVNGLLSGASTVAIPAAPTRVYMGSAGTGTGQFLNDYLEAAALVPRALTDAELQAWSGAP